MQNIDLENHLSRLESLERAGLIAEWQALSDKPLPKKMSVGMLRLLVAYTIQARAYPKAVARVERRLASLIRQRRGRKTEPSVPQRKAPAGTRLIRAWKGETHEVTVREDGFSWKGQTYKSLSEIARSITGTRWNGPRFFGLPHTKNGHARWVPLSEYARSSIEAARGADPLRIFPLSANAVRLAWERIKRRAGINGLHFHDLRHEAVSRFFELGLTAPEVAAISGHRDLRMLGRYAHASLSAIHAKISLHS